jgi:hypothetical protein
MPDPQVNAECVKTRLATQNRCYHTQWPRTKGTQGAGSIRLVQIHTEERGRCRRLGAGVCNDTLNIVHTIGHQSQDEDPISRTLSHSNPYNVGNGLFSTQISATGSEKRLAYGTFFGGVLPLSWFMQCAVANSRL